MLIRNLTQVLLGGCFFLNLLFSSRLRENSSTVKIFSPEEMSLVLPSDLIAQMLSLMPLAELSKLSIDYQILAKMLHIKYNITHERFFHLVQPQQNYFDTYERIAYDHGEVGYNVIQGFDHLWLLAKAVQLGDVTLAKYHLNQISIREYYNIRFHLRLAFAYENHDIIRLLINRQLKEIYDNNDVLTIMNNKNILDIMNYNNYYSIWKYRSMMQDSSIFFYALTHFDVTEIMKNPREYDLRLNDFPSFPLCYFFYCGGITRKDIANCHLLIPIVCNWSNNRYQKAYLALLYLLTDQSFELQDIAAVYYHVDNMVDIYSLALSIFSSHLSLFGNPPSNPYIMISEVGYNPELINTIAYNLDGESILKLKYNLYLQNKLHLFTR